MDSSSLFAIIFLILLFGTALDSSGLRVTLPSTLLGAFDAARISALTMRPPGPVPVIELKSILSIFARRRARGEA